MNESIEPAPLFRERFNNGSNLVVFGNVHRKHDIAAKLRGKSLQAFCEAFIRIRKSQFSTFTMTRFGDAVGNGTVGDNTRDQELFAGQESHVGPLLIGMGKTLSL